MPRPRKPFKLPAILAEEEVVELIRNVANIKHRIMIMAGYSAGLRVSEITGLKLSNIDSKRMQIHIQGAKGKKDRMAPLSKVLLANLREYYKLYKPQTYRQCSYVAAQLCHPFDGNRNRYPDYTASVGA